MAAMAAAAAAVVAAALQRRHEAAVPAGESLGYTCLVLMCFNMVFALFFYCRSIAAQAPGVQLSEHAQAILSDDKKLGIERNDPVLEAMMNQKVFFLCCILGLLF